MSTDINSTRRSFLKSGALLAVPLAAAAPAAVLGDEGLKARLARLEDEAAIRKLHQSWLRRVNAGAGDAARPLLACPEDPAFAQTVRRIVADHNGEPDTIEVTPDGKSAAGRFACAVEIETSIPQDCTLARMAHAQGSGFVRRTERHLLKVEYVHARDGWTIAKVDFGLA
jgi:hypothetical protein